MLGKFGGGSDLFRYHGMWLFLAFSLSQTAFALTPRKHLDPLAFVSNFFFKSFLDSESEVFSL